MNKLTKQGVRDLDAVSPKRERNKRSPGEPFCVHEWESECDGSCDYNYSCTCTMERCRKCGKKERL